MSRYDIISKERGDYYAVDNLIDYVADPDHCEQRFIGATNIFIENYITPEQAVGAQIYDVLRIHNAFNQRRPCFHITIAFSPSEVAALNPEMALRFCYEFVSVIFPYFPCYFAIHDNTDKMHIHLAVVSCDIFCGTRFAASKSQWRRIAHTGNMILAKYIGADHITDVQLTIKRGM